MQVSAKARFIRITPRKARLVTDLIKEKQVDEAMATLRFLPQGAARIVAKVVKSAVANAENNYNLSPETLYVVNAYADPGPTMKRLWIRGRGRRDIKLKRTSHITIVVEDREE